MTPARYLPVALLALSLWLHWPLFSPHDPPYRDSIEPGYASMARFIAQHPNPWGWNPTQYGGMPTQFMYVPLLPYTAAAASWVTGADPAYAYRCVTATFALLAPLSLFALVLYFLRAPWWAFATAAAYLLCSPSYGLIEAVDQDRGVLYLPWRLQVMLKYGEGPHNAALALLPLAWIALWRAATRRDFASLLLAGFAMAAVVLANWIGAFALAVSCATLLLAVWGKGREHQFSFTRGFAAAGLAYLLACFWLTPSFIGTIASNWPKDAYGYHLESVTPLLLLGWIGGTFLLRLMFLGRRDVYLCWTTLTLWAFGYLSVVYYSWKHEVLPESRRYTLEFELFIFIAIGAWLWLGLRSRNYVHRFCAVMPLALMLMHGRTQLRLNFTQHLADWKLVPRHSTVEYKIAQWLAAQKPTGRVLVTGGLRFRLNSIVDLAQAGGTFESGLSNRLALDYLYQIRTGEGSAPGAEEARAAVHEMQALGVEYVVVHDVASQEYYRDFKNPAKFEGVLTRAAAFGPDVIYRVPFRSLAVALPPAEFPNGTNWRELAHYAAAADPARAATQSAVPQGVATRTAAPQVVWETPVRVKISGVPAGQHAILSVNASPGWHATGAPIATSKLGFVTLSGDTTLEYQASFEQKLCAAVSLAAWLFALFRWQRQWRAEPQQNAA